MRHLPLPHRSARHLALLILAGLLCACAHNGLHAPDSMGAADQAASERDFEFYEVSLNSKSPIKPSGGVRVHNPWGDIRVRNHAESTVKVDAAIQRIGTPRPTRPEIEVIDGDGHVSVEVRYPQASIEPRTGRVDLIVFVPRGSSLDVRTLDGYIEIRKTHNPVRAQSTSGQISLVNEGSASLTTDSGEIHLRPIRPGWGRLTAHSNNGLVAAFLPQSPNLSVEVTTANQVSAEFDLERSGDSWKTESGDGRDRVEISSQGEIKLYKVFLSPEEMAKDRQKL